MSQKHEPKTPAAVVPALAPARAQVLAAVAIPNAITPALALWNRWPLDALLWPYWLQLVVAGVFNNLRMRRAALLPIRASSREFVSARAIGGKGWDLSEAGFFCAHYGIFTAFAAGLTGALTALPGWQVFVVLVVAATFALLPRQPLKACLLFAALYWVGYIAVPTAQTWGILASGASFAATQFYIYHKHLAIDRDGPRTQRRADVLAIRAAYSDVRVFGRGHRAGDAQFFRPAHSYRRIRGD
jgi:Family of unknown function (DUF6498)